MVAFTTNETQTAVTKLYLTKYLCIQYFCIRLCKRKRNEKKTTSSIPLPHMGQMIPGLRVLCCWSQLKVWWGHHDVILPQGSLINWAVTADLFCLPLRNEVLGMFAVKDCYPRETGCLQQVLLVPRGLDADIGP